MGEITPTDKMILHQSSNLGEEPQANEPDILC